MVRRREVDVASGAVGVVDSIGLGRDCDSTGIQINGGFEVSSLIGLVALKLEVGSVLYTLLRGHVRYTSRRGYETQASGTNQATAMSYHHDTGREYTIMVPWQMRTAAMQP